MKTNNLTIKQEAFCQAYIRLGDVYSASLESKIELKNEYGTKYYVYFLINPIDNSIFYVGKGKNKRAQGHLKENRSGKISNSKKHKIINAILEANLEPIIYVFENELEENIALSLEKDIITSLKKIITNKSKGFLDKHSRNIERFKTISRRIIPFEVWIKIKERTHLEIETYKSCVEMVNNIANGTEKLYDTISIRNINGQQKIIRQ